VLVLQIVAFAAMLVLAASTPSKGHPMLVGCYVLYFVGVAVGVWSFWRRHRASSTSGNADA
jgi:hypothetical protein